MPAFVVSFIRRGPLTSGTVLPDSWSHFPAPECQPRAWEHRTRTRLARAWWSIPRTFASFSLGFGGKRLFSFGVSGNRFPHSDFATSVRPWIEHESKAWADSDEVLEGAGCWSPLFPARYDDVVLAAAVCVKELETSVGKRPTEPRFRVFAQSLSEDAFQGFAAESAPPALEALAS